MRKIEVVPYDPDWATLFEAEAEKIKEVLGENCLEIHHIGSTSVPGLAAKPIIDMIPVVKNITEVDLKNPEMIALGYEAKGEFGIPFRRYFQKGVDVRTHNVHVFEAGSTEIDRHLKFRDWMRENEADRQAYASLKQDLAERFPDDIMGYCLGKSDFVASIDKKAGWNGLRLVMALTPEEWTVYHALKGRRGGGGRRQERASTFTSARRRKPFPFCNVSRRSNRCGSSC
ncbi:MAG: GrpB family protein [bacterium]|nr:GrpB family protein [bacterium]